jgi:hypothetical protein
MWARTDLTGKSPWALALPHYSKDRTLLVAAIVANRVTADGKFRAAWLKADPRPRPSWVWAASVLRPERGPKEEKNAAEILQEIYGGIEAHVEGLELALKATLRGEYKRFVALATKGKKGKKS